MYREMDMRFWVKLGEAELTSSTDLEWSVPSGVKILGLGQ
jgi:hypothetical protein